MRNLINLVEMNEYEAKAILGTNSSDPDVIKAAFRNAMKTAHPDVGGTTEKAQKVGQAYELLKSLEGRSSSKYQTKSTWAEPEEPKAPKINFHDLAYVRYYFDNLDNGQPKQKWTVMNFDGRFFRGMFSVQANLKMMPEVARVMRIWDNNYESRAVFVGTDKMLSMGEIFLIDIDGKPVTPAHKLYFENSINNNPANDRHFCERIPGMLDHVKEMMAMWDD